MPLSPEGGGASGWFGGACGEYPGCQGRSLRAQNHPTESTQSCPTLCDPWTGAHQFLLSMESPGQEYGSGLPFPPPGELFAHRAS